MADDVKAKLRRIAHSINETQVKEAVQSFKSWDRYEGKLKSWFQGFSNFLIVNNFVMVIVRYTSRSLGPIFLSY